MKAQEVAEKRAAHVAMLEEEKKAKEEKSQEEQKVEDKKSGFFTDLEKSDDLNDKLQNLADFLQEHTSATGVYIGYLQHPEVDIEDDAMELDHLN